MSLLIAFAGLDRPAEAETLKLKDKLTTATGLLEKVMQHQYDTMMSEIEDTIREEGYDYSYSVESFTDLGNPFKDMDYIKLLATYSSILSRAKRENKTLKYDLRTVPYITYNYTEAVSEEKSIHKVEDYEEIEGREGFYEKTGYHYSDMDEEEGVYEETDEPGVFRPDVADMPGFHLIAGDALPFRAVADDEAVLGAVFFHPLALFRLAEDRVQAVVDGRARDVDRQAQLVLGFSRRCAGELGGGFPALGDLFGVDRFLGAV